MFGILALFTLFQRSKLTKTKQSIIIYVGFVIAFIASIILSGFVKSL